MKKQVSEEILKKLKLKYDKLNKKIMFKCYKLFIVLQRFM